MLGELAGGSGQKEGTEAPQRASSACHAASSTWSPTLALTVTALGPQLSTLSLLKSKCLRSKQGGQFLPRRMVMRVQ